MAGFSPYDPKEVTMFWNGIPVTGFMSGTMITAERDEDSVNAEAGSQGDVVATLNGNKMGTVVATLQQTSPSNLLLSAQMAASEVPVSQGGGGLVRGDLIIKDLNGATLVSAEEAWIKRPANVEFSNELTGREWTFGCAELFMTVGGSENT